MNFLIKQAMLVLQIFLLNMLNSVTSQQKPILILSFFRHGAREVEYIHAPYALYKYAGELTPIGMRQHYIIGRELRKKYDHLFGSTFNQNYIKIVSTDFKRTINSAQSQLFGIYSLGSGPNIPQGLDNKLLLPPFNIDPVIPFQNSSALPKSFLPVPIQNTPRKYEYILRSFDAQVCSLASGYQKQQLESEEFKELEKLTFELRKELTEKLELKLTNQQVVDLYNSYLTVDNIISAYYQGKTIPYQIDSEFWNQTLALWEIVFLYAKFSGERQKKLFKTPINNEIIKQLEDKANNKSDFKAIFYSAHDSTQFNLLNGLNIISYKCFLEKFKAKIFKSFPDDKCPRGPRYASTIIFELYSPEKQGDEHQVRIIYDNQEIFLCDEAKKKACKLSEFKKIAQENNVEDYYKVCDIQISKKQKINNSNNSTASAFITLDYIILIFLGISALIVLIFAILTCKKLQEVQNQPFLNQKSIN